MLEAVVEAAETVCAESVAHRFVIALTAGFQVVQQVTITAVLEN